MRRGAGSVRIRPYAMTFLSSTLAGLRRFARSEKDAGRFVRWTSGLLLLGLPALVALVGTSIWLAV